MYTLKTALKAFEFVSAFSARWDITELHFYTPTYASRTHTLCSLPAVRSMSVGPCFLSHTGPTVLWTVIVGRGLADHQEVTWVSSRQLVPRRHEPGNSVIERKLIVCDGFCLNTKITEEALMADLNETFARLGVSHLWDQKWSNTYSHPVTAGVIGQSGHQMIVILSSSETLWSFNVPDKLKAANFQWKERHDADMKWAELPDSVIHPL